MKTVKLLVLPLIALLVCGCNYDLIDTNFTYDKAICEVNGKYEEKEIKKIPIPEIECKENERILRAEIKINELIDKVNEMRKEK